MRRALRAAPPLPESAVAAAAEAAAGAAAGAHTGAPGAAPAVEGAAAIDSTAARGCGDAAPSAAIDGWSIVDDDCMGARLRWLCGAARHGGAAGDGSGVGDGGRGDAGAEAGVPPPLLLPLLQLHESGAPLQSALQAAAGASAAGVSRGGVLLFGDHVGYTPDEEAAVLAAGGVRCALGQVPLLTSQCMVIAHFLLDAANSGLGPAAPV